MSSRYRGCECFWLEPTGREGVRLRRFTFQSKKPCPANDWGHDASSPIIAYRKMVLKPSEHGDVRTSPRNRARSNPAWPKACEACGYLFADDDAWKTNGDPEWRRDDGTLIVAEASHLPPGALFHWGWDPWKEWRDRYGDGINLYAICPNGGSWGVDGAAWVDGKQTKPEAWTRSGDPRRPGTLTVTPSIIAGDYHGWLGINGAQPGHFSDDLGG